jgi:Amt family ammonium transporter
VWPLHGLCGAWGGIACGIFGLKTLGGMGGVSFGAQLIGTVMGIAVAVVGAGVLYGILKAALGLRLTEEEEFDGSDLSIHRIHAEPQPGQGQGGW